MAPNKIELDFEAAQNNNEDLPDWLDRSHIIFIKAHVNAGYFDEGLDQPLVPLSEFGIPERRDYFSGSIQSETTLNNFEILSELLKLAGSVRTRILEVNQLRDYRTGPDILRDARILTSGCLYRRKILLSTPSNEKEEPLIEAIYHKISVDPESDYCYEGLKIRIFGERIEITKGHSGSEKDIFRNEFVGEFHVHKPEFDQAKIEMLTEARKLLSEYMNAAD